MITHNPKNERIKRQYFTYLREANKADETTVDAVAASIARFETYMRHRDFKSFHQAQAIAFKRHLAEDVSKATGDKLSKATLYAMLMHLKRFFVWLAGQPGYKSSLCYSDADYFNLPRKEDRSPRRGASGRLRPLSRFGTSSPRCPRQATSRSGIAPWSPSPC